MEFTGERFLPGMNLGEEIEAEHYVRYHALRDAVRGKAVLDAACGEGYGSAILARTAARVTGMDLSAESIDHARRAYNADNLAYVEGSVTSIPLPDRSVDLVVSFETIEHVDASSQGRFLEEIGRVLTPSGILVISTPDRRVYSEVPGYRNEYHLKEFSREEFEDFLRARFGTVVIFEQRRETAYTIRRADTGSVTLVKGGDSRGETGAKYLVAVCGNGGEAAGIDLSAAIFTGSDPLPQLVGELSDLRSRLAEQERLLAAASIRRPGLAVRCLRAARRLISGD